MIQKLTVFSTNHPSLVPEASYLDLIWFSFGKTPFFSVEGAFHLFPFKILKNGEKKQVTIPLTAYLGLPKKSLFLPYNLWLSIVLKNVNRINAAEPLLLTLK